MSDDKYREFPDSLTDLEEEILGVWSEEGTFERSLERTRESEPFVFYEGPPTANGRPGIHHILARTLKDTFCRYRTMQGRHVTRIAGWDTHGLPVEVEAEKALGISGKREIEEIGVERFTQECRDNLFTYKEDWEQLSQRIGFWLDYSRAYITCSPEYIESVWWALARFHEKGLLYRGHKVVPYCARCGTGLSSHEVALGYSDVTEPAVTVKFPIRGRSGEYLLAWTTTPWTLPGNVGLAVGADITYLKVRVGGDIYYLAEPLAEDLLEDRYETLEKMPGSQLDGLEYEPPFPFLKAALDGDDVEAWYVTTADFVAAEEGTGIVHTAVMYGEDDYELGQRLGLPMHHLVDEEGQFTDEVEPWAGLFVKEADPKIISELEEQGLLFKQESYTHTYPFCWRCDTPLIYYARDSWYLRTTAIKDALLANNASVDWHPPEIGTGRFGGWLENNVDWALSRDRYWGTPLPVWVCDRDASHLDVIESYERLAGRTGSLPDDFDPHKPLIDSLEWPCDDCDGTMRRTPEVIDAWFDSGSMPFAQWHYPFEDEALFEEHFPADFIAEGVDQTRGWFYSLMAIGTVLFERSPYRNVLVNDLILDADGVKMSKSRGNVVDPWSALDEFGADAIRYYLLTVSQPWLPKRYDPSAIAEVNRRFFATLAATYRFFQMYANIESWRPGGDASPAEERPVMDRWLLSRLDALVESCRDDLDSFDVTRSVRRIGDFVVDDLSNWYVRRSRARFWGTRTATRETLEDAFATLWEALRGACRLIAPAVPFVSDWIHRELTGDSVHLAAYPAPAGRRDEDLEDAMELVRQLAGMGRAAREAASIKVRQPLRRLNAVLPGGRVPKIDDEVLAVLRDELNVREVAFLEDASQLVSLAAKPNFAVLGPEFGERAPAVGAAIRDAEPDHLAAWRAEGGPLELEVEGEGMDVPADAVELTEVAREGVSVHSEGGYVVGLETTVNEELRLEGMARELINRIQRLRRDAGLDVADRISLGIFGSPDIASAVEAHRDYIAGEVLAVAVEIGDGESDPGNYRHTRRVQLNSAEAIIAVERS